MRRLFSANKIKIETMASGTGSSGSTQWTNGPRARLYFSEIKRDGVDDDTGHRELKVIKSNYGPSGGSLERMAADQNAETAFLRLRRCRVVHTTALADAWRWRAT